MRELFEAFEGVSKKLYHVGGSVRDMAIGRTPNDYDFTTDALPQEIQHILTNNGYKHWPIGEKFGTIATTVGGYDVEITTHRKDITRGRHPVVEFTTNLQHDLARRDFTINSMAMEKDGTIIDPFGGIEDLHEGIIKATGDPLERFSEDPLRMLRAIRFVSKLGFSIEPKTGYAMSSLAHTILSVSRERWCEELSGILNGKKVAHGLKMLNRFSLLGFVLPELYVFLLNDPKQTMKSKNLWEHTKDVVSKVPTHLKWAALLHDIGKPYTRKEFATSVHFLQHDKLGSELAEGICRRLKMSALQTKTIVGLISLHHRFDNLVELKDVSTPSLRRLIRDCEENSCAIDDLLILFEADCSSKEPTRIDEHLKSVQAIKDALSNVRSEDLRPRLPKNIGNEIMKKFGIGPGPKVGEIKNRLDQMLLNGEITSDMSIDLMLQRIEI